MDRRTRLVVYYLLAVVGVLSGVVFLYNYGVATWEGRPQPLYRSIEVVVQTVTTVGYGGDAPWSSPQMNYLVSLMALSGLVLIFAAVPVLVVPSSRKRSGPVPPPRFGASRTRFEYTTLDLEKTSTGVGTNDRPGGGPGLQRIVERALAGCLAPGDLPGVDTDAGHRQTVRHRRVGRDRRRRRPRGRVPHRTVRARRPLAGARGP